METKQLLAEIKTRLAQVHGQRLQGVILYGSQARGEQSSDSDVDILVLLSDPVNLSQDLQLNISSLFALSLDIGKRISAKPVSAIEYETIDCPLYQRVHDEGIAA